MKFSKIFQKLCIKSLIGYFFGGKLIGTLSFVEIEAKGNNFLKWYLFISLIKPKWYALEYFKRPQQTWKNYLQMEKYLVMKQC